MTVSIVIAVKTWQNNSNLEECINKCRQLDYTDFQILVLPDSPVDELCNEIASLANGKQGLARNDETRGHCEEPRRGFLRLSLRGLRSRPKQSPDRLGTGSAISRQVRNDREVHFIPTGPVSPAVKRDIALKYTKADILAFIDDDAYPKSDWLKNAIENFKDKDVAAVGGPALTAPNDTLRQEASGRVYASFLVSAKFAMRYLPAKRANVEDYPSCNFLVRRSAIEELGGFNTNFWPGEDTKLCLDITKKLGKRIIYDPRVIVWHHRRPLFVPHLRQIASYAIHRGYFVKRYPQTSCKIAYFIPSMFLALVAGGMAASIFSYRFRIIYFAAVLLYLSIAFIFSVSGDLRLTVLTFLGIILSHFAYGFYFIRGLFARRLKEETYESNNRIPSFK